MLQIGIHKEFRRYNGICRHRWKVKERGKRYVYFVYVATDMTQKRPHYPIAALCIRNRKHARKLCATLRALHAQGKDFHALRKWLLCAEYHLKLVVFKEHRPDAFWVYKADFPDAILDNVITVFSESV